MVPSPSWPYEFVPQHCTVPLVLTEQAWPSPEALSLEREAPENPFAPVPSPVNGRFRIFFPAVSHSPIRPFPAAPQHLTDLSERSAQLAPKFVENPALAA